MTKQFFGESSSKEDLEEKLSHWGLGNKMLDPEDIARLIVWLLSEASMGINGVNLPVGEGAP
jgi:chanoclavine-I dehydrogenase